MCGKSPPRGFTMSSCAGDQSTGPPATSDEVLLTTAAEVLPDLLGVPPRRSRRQLVRGRELTRLDRAVHARPAELRENTKVVDFQEHVNSFSSD